MRGLAEQIGAELRLLAKTGLVAGGGVLLLAVASLFTENPASTFSRIISFAGTAMLILSVAMMIFTFRKARMLVPGALLVSLAIAILTTLVQLVLAGRMPSLPLALAALAAGALLGAAWSLTSLLFIDGEMVRSRGTAWYLAVWGVTFALAQIMSALANGIPAAMAALMLVSSGIVAGNVGGTLLRYRRALALIHPAAAAG